MKYGSKHDVGKNIARIRKAQGMRQIDLAEALGVSRNTVVEWETGVTYPRRLAEIAAALGVDSTALALCAEPVPDGTYSALEDDLSRIQAYLLDGSVAVVVAGQQLSPAARRFVATQLSQTLNIAALFAGENGTSNN